jgi:hypothetical protein
MAFITRFAGIDQSSILSRIAGGFDELRVTMDGTSLGNVDVFSLPLRTLIPEPGAIVLTAFAAAAAMAASIRRRAEIS